MKLTHDESRALTFIAALLLLSAGARLTTLPEPVELPPAIDLPAHIAAIDSAVADVERAATPLAPDERIDPNTAPVTELMRLPRVGRGLAERIVAVRDTAPFRSPEDMLRVPGVGPTVLAGMEAHLAVRRVGVRVGVRVRVGDAAGPQGLVTATPVLGGAGLEGEGGAEGRAEDGVVDPNVAGVEELVGLRGVGPVLAARIVAYRDSAGPFRSAEDLLAVPGIGPATLERIRPRLPRGWR